MTHHADVLRRFQHTIVASRVGDAMGTPTELLTAEEIAERFGWVETFHGDGTDDSMMATILGSVLVRTDGTATIDDWATGILEHRDQIRAKYDKFFPSMLHLLEKLASGYRASDVAAGNMPSTTSAMCIWPVGLIHAGDPRGAASHAIELGQLIHTGHADHCVDAAGAVAAAVAEAVRPGSTIDSVLSVAAAAPRAGSGRRMAAAIADAIALADESADLAAFRTAYLDRFSRPIFCDSLETVPATLGIIRLAGGEVRRAVEYGANFGRDTDTIASMAGAICAGLADRLPQAWLDGLGDQALSEAAGLAEQLHGAAVRRARADELRLAGSRAALGIDR